MDEYLLPPSEFGGKQIRNRRIQPRPHVPTPSEQLMLIYTTGDPSGRTPPVRDDSVDHDVIMTGLLPLGVQRAIRQAAGDLDKGQVWQEIVERGEAADVRVEEL